MKSACMQPQSVKLFGDRVVEHPAKQGERYMRPSDPHTLRNKGHEFQDVDFKHTGSYAVSGQEQAELHEEENGEEEFIGGGVGK